MSIDFSLAAMFYQVFGGLNLCFSDLLRRFSCKRIFSLGILKLDFQIKFGDFLTFLEIDVTLRLHSNRSADSPHSKNPLNLNLRRGKSKITDPRWQSSTLLACKTLVYTYESNMQIFSHTSNSVSLMT